MTDPSIIRNRLNASPSRRRTRAAGAPRLGGAGRTRLAAAAADMQRARARCRRSARRAARWPRAASGGCGAPSIAPVGGQRPFALDQTARDIIGDRGGDGVDRLVFGDQHPAVAGVLIKAIGAPVVRHVDEGDHVEEQARMLARRQRQIEQVDVRRRLVDDGLERALERRQAAHFELAQLRDRLGALGVLDPRLPDRGCEIRLGRDVVGLVVHRLGTHPRFGREGSANPADRKPFETAALSGPRSLIGAIDPERGFADNPERPIAAVRGK